MMPSLPHFIWHSHLDKKGTYVRMLFIDFSSAFNTIVPQHLIGKLSLLGLNTSLCNWILDFLTGRPQSVWIGSSTSNTTTLSTGAPQGSVLSPLLFTLLTHDCAAMHSSNHIIKFTNDMTVVGLINKDNESAYREEMRELVRWCKVNNLYLNVDKTKEMVVDFRRARQDHSPLAINGSSVEIIKNIKFLGVHIAENLTWTLNTSSITRRAQQHLYFLRKLRKAHLPSPILTTFYSGTVGNILSSCIITWFGNCTVFDRKTLQRTPEKIIGVSLPSITNIYITRCIQKATNIVKVPTQPSHELFTLLPSGRRSPRHNHRRRNLSNLTDSQRFTPSHIVVAGGLWNCQSAVQKADFISALASLHFLHFLALTETWITPENSATPAALSSAFSFTHSLRHFGRGGGTGLLMSREWRFTPLSFFTLSISSFELHAIPTKFLIIVIYHPPGSLDHFIDELDILIEGNPLILLGDFNLQSLAPCSCTHQI
ncbi:hypothetical protein P4O66_000184 [Electrophorus voltai]|uniref:Reverse transcriptase domain-containing protein n=1 Tax=Electrophorus voltai TaxID=2609070 RepID=A0AAD8ZVY3_9TELE|nr:hypothetical protein P4O66_000184 [Electrophorus voltai]